MGMGMSMSARDAYDRRAQEKPKEFRKKRALEEKYNIYGPGGPVAKWIAAKSAIRRIKHEKLPQSTLIAAKAQLERAKLELKAAHARVSKELKAA